jgi:hypothetical protein
MAVPLKLPNRRQSARIEPGPAQSIGTIGWYKRMYIVLTLALIFAVGFAAHRASLCTVRAVAEILDGRSAHMLGSFIKAAAWTALVSGALLFAMQGMLYPATQRAPYWLALAGGVVFGLGAGLNGGCSLSTIQRLADGELAMLGTLLAFVAGVFAWLLWLEPSAGMATVSLPFRLVPANAWAPWVLGALALWGAWELLRLWRARDGADRSLLGSLLHERWSLSAAALVLGVSGGILYTLQGAWTYTNLLRTEASAWLGQDMSPGGLRWLFLSALIAGMLVSSLQRRAFSLRRPSGGALLRAIGGGTLMGLGAAILPGGNDTLVLIAIPTLAPSAIGIYVAVLTGVAAALLALRFLNRAGS